MPPEADLKDHPAWFDPDIGRYTYETARALLPEETKADALGRALRAAEEMETLLIEGPDIKRLMGARREVKRTRELAAECVARLGGDTDERLHKVMSAYDIKHDSDWFIEGYGNRENDLLRRLLARIHRDLGLSPDQLVVGDMGAGYGRTLKMLLEIVQEDYGDEVARQLAKNCFANDLMGKNTEDARETLEPYGVPRRNLVTGSYRDPFKAVSVIGGKKAHLLLCMFHSIFYNVTESQWRQFLTLVRDNLEIGGSFVFDTVSMRRSAPTCIDDPSAIASLDDLKNLYTQLWLQYCRDNQQFMPPGVDLRLMPRFPLFDNTTGKGRQWREVPDRNYVKHIATEVGGFEWVSSELYKPTLNPPERAVPIGRKWIVANGLEALYTHEIERRLNEGEIDPSLLRREGEDVNALLNYVATHMVLGYQNEYHVFQRIS
ncbi:hypothetical protein COY07_02955 [Candidatus Peregrinibacteria bacterium CG_4_10_14_0_2_um_filter_43_11]|nr:MAG: hypothetical protein COY07_02955 [Candidatus Peregrinibacteria bacterium CG_4_10_14_0_2_um_filter_43_11]